MMSQRAAAISKNRAGNVGDAIMPTANEGDRDTKLYTASTFSAYRSTMHGQGEPYIVTLTANVHQFHGGG